MHEKKGMMRKNSLFLWSSVAVTQICTLAVIHNGTCYNPGHGSRHFQNKRFQFIYISCSPFPHISSLFPQRSLTSPSLVCLYIHFSSPLSPLHLHRDQAFGKLSCILYESSVCLVGTARTQSVYLCHSGRQCSTAAIVKRNELYTIQDYVMWQNLCKHCVSDSSVNCLSSTLAL